MNVREVFDSQQGPLKVDLLLALSQESVIDFLTACERKLDEEIVGVSQGLAYGTMELAEGQKTLMRIVAVKQFIKEFGDLSQIEL